jgi:uncharacterized protein (TIGR02118 family)
MIRISVLYAQKPGARFDHAYYKNVHCPLVEERLKDYGVLRVETDRGLRGQAEGSPAPFVAIGHVIVDSLERYQAGLAVHGAEIAADVARYTDLEPVFQISEIVS